MARPSEPGGASANGETGEAQESPPRLWADVRTSDGDQGSVATVRDRFELAIDEPPWVPVGEDGAPCPGDCLLVATAGCQVEVLKQALEKARIEEDDVHLRVERSRDDSGTTDAPGPFPAHTGIRYDGLSMALTVETTPEYEARIQRCIDVCEDACIIGRSVEAGVDITLTKELRTNDE